MRRNLYYYISDSNNYNDAKKSEKIKLGIKVSIDNKYINKQREKILQRDFLLYLIQNNVKQLIDLDNVLEVPESQKWSNRINHHDSSDSSITDSEESDPSDSSKKYLYVKSIGYIDPKQKNKISEAIKIFAALTEIDSDNIWIKSL